MKLLSAVLHSFSEQIHGLSFHDPEDTVSYLIILLSLEDEFYLILLVNILELDLLILNRSRDRIRELINLPVPGIHRNRKPDVLVSPKILTSHMLVVFRSSKDYYQVLKPVIGKIFLTGNQHLSLRILLTKRPKDRMVLRHILGIRQASSNPLSI